MKEKEKKLEAVETPGPSKKHAHQILCSCQASPPVTRTRSAPIGYCRADIRFALLLKRKAAGKGSKKKKDAEQPKGETSVRAKPRAGRGRQGQGRTAKRERERGETGGQAWEGPRRPAYESRDPQSGSLDSPIRARPGREGSRRSGGARAAPIRARSLLCPRGVRSCGGPRRAGSCCVLPGGCC
jgi:hypothetical protein